MSDRQILVTSALPYANGHIHLGHLVEYIQTDIWVRFQKLRGNRCVYVCADDTHGTAITLRARRESRSEEEVIADMREAHLRDFGDFAVQFITEAPIVQRIKSFAMKFGHRLLQPDW